MSSVRWGVLSTARIATGKVIPGMRAAARTEVLGIASRDGAVAQRAADRLGIPRAYGSYEALLADRDIDAVYIPLPNHLHATWAIRAIEAGKHVLCEKPLALSADDARRMAAAADRAGVLLMEAFMYRLHPAWLKVRELVASGRIGEVVAVDSWFAYHNDDPEDIRNTLAAGGGALWDIGCYSVNLSRLLFGAEPDDVQAAIRRDPASGCDIVTSAILRFGEGVATFTCATRMEPDQRVDVYGTRGRIHVPIPFNIPPDRPTTIDLVAGGDPPVAPGIETFTFAAKDPYAAEVEGLAAAVLDGAPVPTPIADAIANIEVIERVFAAADAR